MTKGNLLSRFILLIGIFLSTQVNADTLRGALENTIQSNPDIIAAVKDRLAVNQALKEAESGYYPKIDVTAGYGREHTENPSIPTIDNVSSNTATLWRGEAGVAVNQMLFDGLGTLNEVSRNKQKVNSAAYKVAGTAQDIALRASETYIDVLRQEKYVELSRKNLEIHESVFAMIKKRAETGIGRTADLVQAQGRLALARSNLAADEANLVDAQSNYFRVIGQMPNNLIMPSPPAQNKLPRNEKEAVAWAVSNHPTLRSAIADLEAARFQHRASYAADFPRVDLQLSANNDNNVDGISGSNQDDQAMVRMSWNVFHGGADYYRQRETAYLYQEAMEVMHHTYRQTIETMQLAWNSLVITRRQNILMKEHRDASLQTVTSYREQFQLGQRTLLDVLDAQNEYYSASKDYVDNSLKELYSQYRILNAYGCLLQELGVSLPRAGNIPSRA